MRSCRSIVIESAVRRIGTKIPKHKRSRPGFCRGGIFVGGVPVGNGYGRSGGNICFIENPGRNRWIFSNSPKMIWPGKPTLRNSHSCSLRAFHGYGPATSVGRAVSQFALVGQRENQAIGLARRIGTKSPKYKRSRPGESRGGGDILQQKGRPYGRPWGNFGNYLFSAPRRAAATVSSASSTVTAPNSARTVT